MIYCISDIHGMENLFEKMLSKINLQRNDTLYVLGDCIDRGGGLGVLQHIMRLQKSGLVRFIKGNHEMVFANSIQQFDPKLTIKMYKGYTGSRSREYTNGLYSVMYRLINSENFLESCEKAWPSAASAATLSGHRSFYSCNDFFNLSDEDQENILSFIRESPVYADVVVAGKKYRLTHAGCNQDGSISSDIRREFFTQKTPLDNTTIVFGHTTTTDIRILTDGVMEEPSIWYDKYHNNDKIGIDCGAPFEHGRLACLRLDDMAEFYVENDSKPVAFLNIYNDYAKISYEPPALNGYKEWSELLNKWLQAREKVSLKEKGEQIIKNIAKMPISMSAKNDIMRNLRMIYNYAELVKTNPTNQSYQKCLLDYAKMAKELCDQYNVNIGAVTY